MTIENPYHPPSTKEPGFGDGASGRPGQKPVSPLVFGILSLILGGLGLLALPLTLIVLSMEPSTYGDMGMSETYVLVTQVVGFVASSALIAAGIGLIRRVEWCRKLFLAWCVLNIVMTLINTAVTLSRGFGDSIPDPFQRTATIFAVFAGLLALIFPILGLVFLTRPKVRASFHRAGSREESPTHGDSPASAGDARW